MVKQQVPEAECLGSYLSSVSERRLRDSGHTACWAPASSRENAFRSHAVEAA